MKFVVKTMDERAQVSVEPIVETARLSVSVAPDGPNVSVAMTFAHLVDLIDALCLAKAKLKEPS